MRKWTAVILSCGMLLSLAGCKAAGTSTEAVQTAESASGENEAPDNTTNENITLKIGFSTDKSD
ncbi:MAG: hypothetical protein ACI4RK_06725, partial [Oscillospiraceae bacterium]